MDKHEQQERDWKWRYTFWGGIIYGPIPVGLISVIVLGILSGLQANAAPSASLETVRSRLIAIALVRN